MNTATDAVQETATVTTLAEAAARISAPQAMGGNRPILLTDPTQAVVVVRGAVDLFSVPMCDQKVAGQRTFIGQVPAGGMLQGLAPAPAGSDGAFAILAVGTIDTQISTLDPVQVQQLWNDPALLPALGAALDAWIVALSALLVEDVPPRTPIVLVPGAPAVLPIGADVSAGADVVWVRGDTSCLLLGADSTQPALPSAGWFPLAQLAAMNDVWARSTVAATLEVCATIDLVRAGQIGGELTCFHGVVSEAVRRKRQIALHDAQAQVDERAAFGAAAKVKTADQLAAVLHRPRRGRAKASAGTPIATTDPTATLLAACQLVGDVLGMTFSPPTEAERVLANRDPLAQITFASRIRSRRVSLETNWWRTDSGPLLGYLKDGSPIALLPRSVTSYDAVDPRTMQVVRVDEAYAQTMDDAAYVFYRRLGDGPVNLSETLRFTLFGLKSDLIWIFVFALALALLGLLVPIATGWLVDTVIPSGKASDLVAMGAVLFAAAVASLLFTVAQQFAILRLQTKSTAGLSAAIWDRLLGLPAGFFRQYTAGDLANRAYGISRIRQLVSDATITAIASGLFSIVNFFLLFYYSPQLALIAVGLALVMLVVTLSTSYYQLQLRRKVSDIQGVVQGVVLQLLNGVTKIRIAGAEPSALGVWANVYAQEQRYTYAAGLIDAALKTFEGVFPLISSICLFAAVGYWLGGTSFQTGVFVAFNVAFSQFLLAAIKQVNAFTSVLQAIPYYERARPILQELPEVTAEKVDPGTLSGRVDVNHIQFAYNEGEPLVLRDISIHANPGKMVALVGPSGAGKSTIIRMLLGFETPTAGGVFYDNQDLKSLNVQAVRRQIGVVLQDGKVMPGTVYDNIVGASLLSETDAWEAARVAGLDQDIRQMPAGMHTAISEGGTTFSGGQLQRLMIARAVVGKPRILIFDEATSALDNETQALVSRNLDEMQVTRIVIAHRLSTIVNADTIFVLQQGAVVQSGAYQDLLAQEGLFRELALRQLA